MKIVESGHTYQLTHFDGEHSSLLIFFKREGDGYPGNIGHHEGTNLQEVIRVLLDRTKYLDNQIEDYTNKIVMRHLRSALIWLEKRAAMRHGLEPPEMIIAPGAIDNNLIEDLPFCNICGHIVCRH